MLKRPNSWMLTRSSLERIFIKWICLTRVVLLNKRSQLFNQTGYSPRDLLDALTRTDSKILFGYINNK